MTRLSETSIDELLEEFVAISIRQGEANAVDDVQAYNQLYPSIAAVVDELKRRAGDKRTALLSLYNHSDMQVRLAAAQFTVEVAPTAARAQFQAIRDAGLPPQSFDAGMALVMMDDPLFRATRS